jgi:excinuclease ABC subunit A
MQIVTGAHRLGDVVMVDQSQLARTPRSTPILYLGLYDRVRELFAAQPEAMAQGLTAARFPSTPAAAVANVAAAPVSRRSRCNS